jgi:hypothetical protein
MKVRYKVVKRNRYSAIVNGNSRYALKYSPGTIVEALPNTAGIFVFKNKTYAENWCAMLMNQRLVSGFYEMEPFIVIKVLPLVRGEKRIFIHAKTTTKALDNFYNGNVTDDWKLQEAPDNTYTHMKVKVLN